jgi:hypothetical protein
MTVVFVENSSALLLRKSTAALWLMLSTVMQRDLRMLTY